MPGNVSSNKHRAVIVFNKKHFVYNQGLRIKHCKEWSATYNIKFFSSIHFSTAGDFLNEPLID